MVKGFAPMIREVVLTERMPPWHADPHYQNFEGARSLSAISADRNSAGDLPGSRDEYLRMRVYLRFVIPAQAGTQAFSGMLKPAGAQRSSSPRLLFLL
jgi:hypothetical protein